jgi:tetratricopeptide (TPR) repeat protein
VVADEGPAGGDVPSVAEARSLHDTGDREASDHAIAHLEELLRASPHDASALFALGEIHLGRAIRFTLGRTELEIAADIGRRLSPLDPARGHELLGRAYRWMGEHSFALEAFAAGLELAPDDAQLRAELAWRHFQTGEHHLGIEEAQRVLAIDPDSVLALEVYGFSLFHLEVNGPDVDAVFEHALAVDAASEGFGGLHLLSLSRADDEAAIAVAERILAERPEWPSAHAFAGHAHYFAGNDEAAIAHLEEAIRLDPDVGVQYTGRAASNPLAYLYLKRGRADEAAGLIEHAEARADRRMYFGFEPWNSYYQYAGIALLRGNRDDALRWLQTALIGGMPGPVLLARDPIYAALRGDARFEEILSRLQARRDEIRRRLGLE